MSSSTGVTVSGTGGPTTHEPAARQPLPMYVLFLTRLVSTFGNQMTALAVPWFVLETTGSAAKMGITAAVTLAPFIIATVFGGTLVDRMSYRKLAVTSDILSGVTVAAVPFFFHTTGLSFTGLLALMFLGSIFDAPGNAARQTMVPELAKRAGMSLERANSNFGVIYAMSSLFGAPLAGFCIAWLGPTNVLWLNAGTFVFSAAMLATFIRLRNRPEPSTTSFLSDVREGFGYLFGNPVMRTIALAAVVINMVYSPLFGVAIPVFANREFGSAADLGILMSGLGLGGLLGSLAYGWLGPRVARRKLFLLDIALLAVPVWGLALLPELWIAWGLLVLTGTGTGMVNPMVGTLFQLRTPPRLLGRAMSTLQSVAMVASPLGLLVGGSLVALLGLSGTILLTAATMLLVLVFCLLSRALHDLNEDPADATAHDLNGKPSSAPAL